MNSYLIKIPYDGSLRHNESIAIHDAQFHRIGIKWTDVRWNHGALSIQGPHQMYSITCTKEQLTMLVLLGAIVIANLPEEKERFVSGF